MISRTILILLAATFPLCAMAQGVETIVPQSREQVQLSFSPLVKKVSPAVVNIYTKRTVSRTVGNPFLDDPLFAPFFQDQRFGSRMRKQVEGALGSGVIIEPDGLIVTNSHVIRGADEITVVLSDGREFDAKLSLQDDASDLSLLRINAKGEQLPHASLKPSESLEVGDLVLAIGNPFGVGQTVTSGIVSALARSSLDISDFNFFIQTDAAINPGNSGGPLVALDGGVVGINSAIYSRDGGSLGIGFAVPSEMVASVVAAEKSGKKAAGNGIVRPWLGITAQRVTSDIAESMKLETPRGALVTELHEASPLKKAGIEVGDVVVKMNGKDIHDPSEMKFRMATTALGGSAEIEVIRNGVRKNFNVEAIAPPDSPPREEIILAGRHMLNGATIARMNPAVAVELGIFGKEEEGIVVLKIEEGSSASRILAPGDTLVEINGVKIEKTGQVEKAMSKEPRGIALIVRNNGRLRQIVVR